MAPRPVAVCRGLRLGAGPGHARSGDPAHLANYLGSGDRFDRAMGDFAEAYADQNERDYQAFLRAIDAGKIEASDEG